MELTILRHGIAVDHSQWNGSDAARPLTPEGRVQTRAVIQSLLRTGKLAPAGAPTGFDAIWSSPYVRTRQTAEIVAEILGGNVVVAQELASGSDWLRTLPPLLPLPVRLLCVGHNPDVGLAASRLVGDPGAHFSFSRAGCARFVGEFAPGAMKTDWFYSAAESIGL